MLLFAIRVVESMFFIGIVGSALVLILTAIDDVRELLGHDDDKDLERRGISPRLPREAALPR